MQMNGYEELCSVYVPTNHLYIGDVFLINSEDIIRPNLSIREAIGQCFLLMKFNKMFFLMLMALFTCDLERIIRTFY